MRDESDIAAALAYARAVGLEVSLSGVRHSMGGHAFYHGALVLDLTGMRSIRVECVDSDGAADRKDVGRLHRLDGELWVHLVLDFVPGRASLDDDATAGRVDPT